MMRCATCKQASSKKLHVSDVCRDCHNHSHHIPAGIMFQPNTYTIILYLHEYQDGERFVSTERYMGGAKVIAEENIAIRFGGE